MLCRCRLLRLWLGRGRASAGTAVVAYGGDLGLEAALFNDSLRELRAEDLSGDLEPIEGFFTHRLAHLPTLNVLALRDELGKQLLVLLIAGIAALRDAVFRRAHEVANKDGLGDISQDRSQNLL